MVSYHAGNDPYPNTAQWWVVGGALIFLSLALYIPLLRDLFHFSTLHVIDLAICLVAGIAGVMWFEWLKWRRGKNGDAVGRG
jgi:P-type Ca2+ transporter type 2C